MELVIKMLVAKNWQEYTLLDGSDGMKIERWGKVVLVRPDPQIVWKTSTFDAMVKKADAIYHRSNKGGGAWENKRSVPASWKIHYKELTFCIKQMGFKHTGLFPEQAVNWDFMINKIKTSNRPISVLNLFAYTGGATVACLSAGASVVHVDSSKGMVDWAKENVKASSLEGASVRYIIDDVKKFVEREIRRGHKYDAIVMDPPSYGKGANKEIWDIEQDLFPLLLLCKEILVENPLFLLINSYTAGLSSQVLENMLRLLFPGEKGTIDCGEIGLPFEQSSLVLPCGIYGRYESHD